MTTVKRYTSLIVVAVLAASAGWGFSALATRRDPNAVTSQPAAPAPQDVVPATAVPAPGLNQSSQFATAPANIAATPEKSALTAQPGSSETAAAPVARSSASRAPVVHRRTGTGATSDVARSESREVRPASTPAYEHKSGMSNKTKTAIVIGGGAATGAILGGIAGGKKGAAIGAILGGGGGAVYSVIRNKQHKPVW